MGKYSKCQIQKIGQTVPTAYVKSIWTNESGRLACNVSCIISRYLLSNLFGSLHSNSKKLFSRLKSAKNSARFNSKSRLVLTEQYFHCLSLKIYFPFTILIRCNKECLIRTQSGNYLTYNWRWNKIIRTKIEQISFYKMKIKP